MRILIAFPNLSSAVAYLPILTSLICPAIRQHNDEKGRKNTCEVFHSIMTLDYQEPFYLEAYEPHKIGERLGDGTNSPPSKSPSSQPRVYLVDVRGMISIASGIFDGGPW